MLTKPIDESLLQSCVDVSREKDFSLAEFIAYSLKDQLIEVYVGDSYEQISTEQVSTNYPAVFIGKVVTAYKECLILNCCFVKNKELKFGNPLFINERSIRAVNIATGEGMIIEMFSKSHETKTILDTFRKCNK